MQITIFDFWFGICGRNGRFRYNIISESKNVETFLGCLVFWQWVDVLEVVLTTPVCSQTVPSELRWPLEINGKPARPNSFYISKIIRHNPCFSRDRGTNSLFQTKIGCFRNPHLDRMTWFLWTITRSMWLPNRLKPSPGAPDYAAFGQFKSRR